MNTHYAVLLHNSVHMQMNPHQIINIWCLHWIYNSNSGWNAVYFKTICTLWLSELSDLRSGVSEDSVLLGYCTSSLHDQCAMFLDCVRASSGNLFQQSARARNWNSCI